MHTYELRNVSKHYDQGSTAVRAVDDVDLVIDQGEFVVVTGTSGSGKSTMLQLLGALDRPTGGELLFEEEDLASLPDRRLADLRLRAFGFVFQQFNLIPTLTATENVEAALAPTRMERGDRHDRCVELLDQVGLAERGHHLPSQLSGGEQQRVAIARALRTSRGSSWPTSRPETSTRRPARPCSICSLRSLRSTARRCFS